MRVLNGALLRNRHPSWLFAKFTGEISIAVKNLHNCFILGAASFIFLLQTEAPLSFSFYNWSTATILVTFIFSLSPYTYTPSLKTDLTTQKSALPLDNFRKKKKFQAINEALSTSVSFNALDHICMNVEWVIKFMKRGFIKFSLKLHQLIKASGVFVEF